MKISSIRPEYVEYIPREIEDGVLYISKKFRTASHRCCCGCGTKIVTPLRETEYTLTDRHGLISLHPSIGNWNYPCQSHYWIIRNDIVWAEKMSREEIHSGEAREGLLKATYFVKEVQPKWKHKIAKIGLAIKSFFSH